MQHHNALNCFLTQITQHILIYCP